MALKGLHPASKPAFPFSIVEKRYPFDNFAYRDNADKNVLAGDFSNGLAYPGMAAGFPELGQNTGIEKNPHSLTLRMAERSRVR